MSSMSVKVSEWDLLCILQLGYESEPVLIRGGKETEEHKQLLDPFRTGSDFIHQEMFLTFWILMINNKMNNRVSVDLLPEPEPPGPNRESSRPVLVLVKWSEPFTVMKARLLKKQRTGNPVAPDQNRQLNSLIIFILVGLVQSL